MQTGLTSGSLASTHTSDSGLNTIGVRLNMHPNCTLIFLADHSYILPYSEYAERFFYIGAGGSFAHNATNEKLLRMVREHAKVASDANGVDRNAAIERFVDQRNKQSIYDQMYGKRVDTPPPSKPKL